MSFGFFCVYGAAGTESATESLCTELIKQGQAVRLYRDIALLCRDLRDSPLSSQVRQVVVLNAALMQVCEYATRIRADHAAVKLVGMVPEISAATVSEALTAGVDVCWHEANSVDVLVASLLRHFQGVADSPGNVTDGKVWRLASRGWKVCPAAGQPIILTAAERRILNALALAGQKRLAHTELLDVMHPGAAPHDPACTGPAAESAHRRLRVLMSRMRRKFLAAGVEPPFASVRGYGYELCVEIVTD